MFLCIDPVKYWLQQPVPKNSPPVNIAFTILSPTSAKNCSSQLCCLFKMGLHSVFQREYRHCLLILHLPLFVGICGHRCSVVLGLLWSNGKKKKSDQLYVSSKSNYLHECERGSRRVVLLRSNISVINFTRCHGIAYVYLCRTVHVMFAWLMQTYYSEC